MKSTSSVDRLRSLPLLAALVLAAGVVTAAALQSAATPTTVAVVDLEVVYNRLDQHRAAEKKIEAMVDALAAEGKKREQELKVVRIEIENFEKGSQAFLDMQRKVEDAVGRLAAFEEFAQMKAQRETERLIKETYDDIKRACAAIAKDRGIQLVLLDDATPQFSPEDRRPMMQQISARRSLYVDPSLDITELVIDRMNREFAARQGGASASP